MCGIVGAFGVHAADSVRLATGALTHRGPDDEGHYRDPDWPVALGHTRLSILDVSSAGHQPMFTSDADVGISYNGEIYNFPELRRDLVSHGHRFRSETDTEVLLALYTRDGEKMLQRLNGIFAFAIWDRNRAELFVARDAFGVKPLYYSAGSGGFAFASELKALLRLVDGGELDAVAIHQYLTFLWSPGERTPFENVRKLGPGEAMVIRAGQIRRHWRWFDIAERQPADPRMDAAEARNGTIGALRTAVRRQLLSDVPVGAFLSGGVDSSAIVALARERIPDISCFTIQTDLSGEGLVDDLPYARRVARHLGVRLDVVPVSSSTMAADLEQMVVQLDEPLADPAPLNVLYISQLARSAGVKVLLSGAGGDDLFTGYRRHFAVRMEPFWSWLPQQVRAAIGRVSGRLDQRNARFRRATKLLQGAGLEGDDRLTNYFRWAQEPLLRSLYSPSMLSRVGHTDAAAPMLDFVARLTPELSPLERLLALEQRFFLTDHNLNYTDKMGMAAGVEIRVPFLDPDLVAFAARIPDHFKQHGRHGKWVLKRAMEPYLPRDVINRPKSGFGAPIRRWMRSDLRDLVGDRLSVESVRARGLFDPAAVQRLISQNDAGAVDAGYTIFSLLCIEIWCRHYLSLGSPVGQSA